MTPMSTIIGLDFGTTNSAAAVATRDGSTVLATFAGDGSRTTTSGQCCTSTPNTSTGPQTPGHGGADRHHQLLEADTRGRLMQSMKSHLASRLFRETYVFGEKYTLEDLIAIILRELRSAAEAQFGDIGSRVVVGRPVHFSGAGARRMTPLR